MRGILGFLPSEKVCEHAFIEALKQLDHRGLYNLDHLVKSRVILGYSRFERYRKSANGFALGALCPSI